ncbi:unnamed protein product [Amoebophrya sp. A25]|nr:unnamed protein product [Amoebophrya sp. A25]|eukprot:GSA25T00003832001.1
MKSGKRIRNMINTNMLDSTTTGRRERQKLQEWIKFEKELLLKAFGEDRVEILKVTSTTARDSKDHDLMLNPHLTSKSTSISAFLGAGFPCTTTAKGYFGRDDRVVDPISKSLSTARRATDLQQVIETRLLTLHQKQNSEVHLEQKLDEVLPSGGADVVLLFDADRTLSPSDTGALFWDIVQQDLNKELRGTTTSTTRTTSTSPLKKVFTQDYHYGEFLQAAKLYQGCAEGKNIYPAAKAGEEHFLERRCNLNQQEKLPEALKDDDEHSSSTGSPGRCSWTTASSKSREGAEHENDPSSSPPLLSYEEVCHVVAGKVDLYPELEKLLNSVSDINIVAKNSSPAKSIAVVVVTCSPKDVWDLILRERFPSAVNFRVVGTDLGVNGSKPLIVDHHVKKLVAEGMRRRSPGCRIVSFGDSVLDVPMLMASDYGFAVVSSSRSTAFPDSLREVQDKAASAQQHFGQQGKIKKLQLSMPQGGNHQHLRSNIDLFDFLEKGTMKDVKKAVFGGLEKLLLKRELEYYSEDLEKNEMTNKTKAPSTTSSTANGSKTVHHINSTSTTSTPSTTVTTTSLLGLSSSFPRLLFDGTSFPSCQELSTRMRNANCNGPDLLSVHEEAGKFLAEKILDCCIGVEHCEIPHVQGRKATGFAVPTTKIAVVGIMRAGLGLALGVWKRLGLSSALAGTTTTLENNSTSANQNNVSLELLKYPKQELVNREKSPCLSDDKSIIVFVDSVINSGKTIIEFVEHIYEQRQKTGVAQIEELKIIVTTGVIQAESLSEGSDFMQRLRNMNVELVTLRVSENKYKGVGQTDTGNRIFNTA